MLKSIGTIQLALATIFVVPAVTGQDENASSLEGQLNATLSSLEYLAGLRSSAEAGDVTAVRAIVSATESPRDATPQRASRLQGLRDDIARLRFMLDRLLADPEEVSAITSLPASVVRTLGLAGSAPDAPTIGSGAATESTSLGPTGSAGSSWTGTSSSGQSTRPHAGTATEPDAIAASGATAESSTNGGTSPTGTAPIGTNGIDRIPTGNPHAARPDVLAGTSPTAGLDETMRAAMQGELRPLDHVSDSARRRGGEALEIEGKGYVADPVRLGKLLVRAGRAAEAIELLENAPDGAERRYWLARAYQAQDRSEEALELYRALSEDEDAGDFGRFASQDLDFLEFKRKFEQRRSTAKRGR